jgi:hypothetical protein
MNTVFDNTYSEDPYYWFHDPFTYIDKLAIQRTCRLNTNDIWRVSFVELEYVFLNQPSPRKAVHSLYTGVSGVTGNHEAKYCRTYLPGNENRTEIVMVSISRHLGYGIGRRKQIV